MRIPIPDLLHHWREKAVEAGLTSTSEAVGLAAYTAAAEHPALFEAGGAALRWLPWKLGGRALPIVGGWMQERTAPEPSPKSFRSLWKDGIE